MCFTNDVEDDYIVLDGLCYVICDPTYINVSFGVASIKNMRQFYENWAPYFDTAAMAAELLPEANKLPRTNDSTISTFNSLTTDSELKVDLLSSPNCYPSVSDFVAFVEIGFVEFLIQGYDNPMGVTTYKTAEDVRKVLPSEDELHRIMDEKVQI